MSFKSKITGLAVKAGKRLQQKCPTLMVVGGVAGLVVAGVLACKETHEQLDNVIAEHKEKVQAIKDIRDGVVVLDEISTEEYAEKKYKKHLLHIYLCTICKLAKVYAPAFLLATASVFSILWGHKIVTKRHLAAVAECYAVRETLNEYRKRVFLMQLLNADVEVKSWVSETIRAYWYKHYGRKSMPELSPKLFRNLYKIFIFNRSLAHETDKIFAKYIDDFEYRKIPAQYPPADMHYNEVTWGSWGGMNISEMKIYADITFIYNNRKFLDLMFRVPLEKRISDQHHLDMKKLLNKELYDMHIRVQNMKETKSRAFMLNVIFTINSFLPF